MVLLKWIRIATYQKQMCMPMELQVICITFYYSSVWNYAQLIALLFIIVQYGIMHN